VNKKLVIIAAALGLVSFAGAFATGWFTSPKAASGATPGVEGAEPSSAGPEAGDAGATSSTQIPPPVLAGTLTLPTGQAAARTLTEEQLKDLIYEVREKIQQYDQKLRELEKEKERLQIAQQTLKKDIETLNNLRVDLAAGVADIKNERDLLAKARVAIAASEKANLVAIAAAYDKMDPVGASQILVNMATGLSKSNSGSAATNIDDAVKILFFMQDRTKAKVLAELVAQEPTLAALLCQKLKQVQEGK
jgi:hypothetical protein